VRDIYKTSLKARNNVCIKAYMFVSFFLYLRRKVKNSDPTARRR